PITGMFRATCRVAAPSVNCSAASPNAVPRKPGRCVKVRAAPLRLLKPPNINPAVCAAVAPLLMAFMPASAFDPMLVINDAPPLAAAVAPVTAADVTEPGDSKTLPDTCPIALNRRLKLFQTALMPDHIVITMKTRQINPIPIIAAALPVAAIIGIGLICLVFIVITMRSGIKAVWNSFNRLFNAMGQVSGSVLLSPGSVTSAAVTGATAAATGGASLATSMGSNALAGMNAMNNGATTAQTAGLMFGGFGSLSNAARTLTHLPGVRGTALGDAAEQFTEGTATRQVARNIPVIGRAAAPLVGAA